MGGGKALPLAIMRAMSTGEWVLSVVGLGVTFLVAVTAVGGLGWWVLRADHRNRVEELGPEHGSAEEG